MEEKIKHFFNEIEKLNETESEEKRLELIDYIRTNSDLFSFLVKSCHDNTLHTYVSVNLKK